LPFIHQKSSFSNYGSLDMPLVLSDLNITEELASNFEMKTSDILNLYILQS
jgi:hypothetical protein